LASRTATSEPGSDHHDSPGDGPNGISAAIEKDMKTKASNEQKN
jgi:hypothetical protein